MKSKRAISLRRHLTYFFLTISIISAFLFGELLIRYFEYGIEDSVKMRMLTEWRAYSEAYEKDNTLPLPSSYVVSFHYDSLPPMIINDLNVFEGLEMENEEFKVSTGQARYQTISPQTQYPTSNLMNTIVLRCFSKRHCDEMRG
ncbi:hypothetical protein QTO05_15475 [Vibrio fortis]|uniref:hypothetical protein n=1 Tax=Vibrio fortis TaxID=212667 RepID=UPI002F427F61